MSHLCAVRQHVGQWLLRGLVKPNSPYVSLIEGAGGAAAFCWILFLRFFSFFVFFSCSDACFGGSFTGGLSLCSAPCLWERAAGLVLPQPAALNRALTSATHAHTHTTHTHKQERTLTHSHTHTKKKQGSILAVCLS